MAERDSGVDTGNESNSMSVGSLTSSDDDKDVNDFGAVSHSSHIQMGASFGMVNVPSISSNYNFSNYLQHEQSLKLKLSQQRKNLRAKWFPIPANLQGRRKLLAAVNMNEIENVKALLENGVNPRAQDTRQRTALHLAAAGGHSEIARLLLEKGADPNQRDSVGNTPLHLAACTSHIEMVTLLLRAGTDINALDNSGRTPFHLAQSKLKLLQRNTQYSSAQVKLEVIQVLEMMRVYLQCSGRSRCLELDLLIAFSNRLHHHQTREEVDTDVADLLSSLSHLSLHKT